MKKYQKFIYQMLVFSGFFLMLGFAYSYHLPKIRSWLLVEIERQTDKHLPLRVWPSKVDLSLIPLGVTMRGVRLQPKAPLDRYLAPASINKISASLSLWGLLKGEFRIGTLKLIDPEIRAVIRETQVDTKKKTFELPFDDLAKIPIDEIQVINLNLIGRLDPQGLVFKTEDLNLTIENRYRALLTEIQSKLIKFKPIGPTEALEVALELRALMDNKEIQISALKLRRNESFILASGRFNGELLEGRLTQTTMDVRTHLNLKEVHDWFNVFRISKKLPTLVGTTELDVSVQQTIGRMPKLNFKLHTDAVRINGYEVGTVDSQGTYENNVAKTHLITAKNSGGEALFRNIELKNVGDKEFLIKAQVETTGINVPKFLQTLKVPKIPVELHVSGTAPCQGSLYPKFEIHCSGNIEGKNLHVHSGPPQNKTIIKLKDIKVKGDATIDLEKVVYRANIEIGPKSKGSSQGTVNYETGFQISYTTDGVDFTDVEDIVNLKTEGRIKVTGTTRGTSHWGVADLSIDLQNGWLTDYPLGNLSADVSYKEGHLHFRNLKGQYESSRYNGLVSFNLPKDEMELTAKIPFADLSDVKDFFQRKVKIPFEVSGTGTADVKAWGPIEFTRLSYDFNSSFYRGNVARESFDEFVFNVQAKNGLVRSQRIAFNKSGSTVTWAGTVQPTGLIDSMVVAKGLRLEQSENVIALGFDLYGQLDFSILVKGQLPRPHMDLNGLISKVVIADQPAGNSRIRLQLNEKQFAGNGQFIGDQVNVDFAFPLAPQTPFKFIANTKNWDFTSLFSILSSSAKQQDFETNLTMQINLNSKDGGFWAADGNAVVDQLQVRRSAISMTNHGPMKLTFNKGVINSDNWVLAGGGSTIKLKVENTSQNQLNASLNGKIELGLLNLIMPFFSDLKGNLSMAINMTGKAEDPVFSGSAYVEKGYAKLKEFIHPFIDFRIDLLFNHRNIIVNSVNSEFANGKIAGEGKISILGRNNIPVDLKGTATNIDVNVPEGFRSRGSGTVSIQGSYFPYIMAIKYECVGGDVTAEFAKTNSQSTVKASSYLPKNISRDNFEPFIYDLDATIINPVSVNNSSMSTLVRGKARVRGTPDDLLITGTFNPQPGGKVFFHDVPFEINTGFVEYVNAPPDNPKLYLTASTRVTETKADTSGRLDQEKSADAFREVSTDYDIDLLVQGRGQKPQITLRSQPPLGQQEIVSLLALGLTPSALDSRGASAQAQNTSTAIGTAILQKPIGKELKNRFGLDVKVSSSQPSAESAALPKVTLSRQMTPKLSVSASQTVGPNPANDAKVEYKMNRNLSVIGSWEGKQENATQLQEEKDTTKSVLGLDLEYRLNFK